MLQFFGGQTLTFFHYNVRPLCNLNPPPYGCECISQTFHFVCTKFIIVKAYLNLSGCKATDERFPLSHILGNLFNFTPGRCILFYAFVSTCNLFMTFEVSNWPTTTSISKSQTKISIRRDSNKRKRDKSEHVTSLNNHCFRKQLLF